MMDGERGERLRLRLRFLGGGVDDINKGGGCYSPRGLSVFILSFEILLGGK